LLTTTEGLCGVCIRAVKGTQVRTIWEGQRPIGSLWADQFGRYLWLSGLLPDARTDSPATQARNLFGKMDHVLRQVGMAFTDVVRTWFYNDRITCWYDQFNRVRNEFFQQHGLFSGLVPASTGIGIPNPYGTAIVGGLLAVKAKEQVITARAVQSPLQGPALEYGSSFSRAVELVWPDHTRLLVSGTASIDQQGRTCHIGDPAGQIGLTIEVVDRLLQANGYGWTDVVRIVAYVTDVRLRQILLERLLDVQDLPIIITPAQICRPDLLFEMECEAIRLTAP
jgi:enamine deaminase RidA (YjgF/YER057c/UK114 family)